MNKLTILYDPSCGFCATCRRWLREQPSYLDLEFISLFDESVAVDYPEIDRGEARGELTVIDDQGGLYKGPDAFIMALYALADYREWSLWLAKSAVRSRARSFFEWVSSNRGSLSKWLLLEPDLANPPSQDLQIKIEETACAVRCTYCRGCLNKATAHGCDACGALLHQECRNEYEGCPSLGCLGTPTPAKLALASQDREPVEPDFLASELFAMPVIGSLACALAQVLSLF